MTAAARSAQQTARRRPPSGMLRLSTHLIIVTVALLLAACTSGGSSDSTGSTAPTAPDTSPCEGPAGVGGPVPAGLGPGDLVAAVDLTPTNSSSPGFPTGGRVWRMLYVSTGVDEADLQLICGLAAAPTAGPTTVDGRGRLLNWAHGTVGVDQSCLPSSNPADLFWGRMAGGINAVAWGSDLGKHEGNPAGGLLQYAMNQGMLVTATDYQPNDAYVVGKIEASDALDAARAGTQLMRGELAASAPPKYDMVIWGHSQGGHAALWAGQLAESYDAATVPSHPTAPTTLVGVAALAPASTFITLAGQPGVQPGDGLADWEMHQNIGLDLPAQSLQMQIGPALFAYIFGSWNQLSQGRAPAATARFPAFPVADAPLALDSVVTTSGTGTVRTVQPMCLTGDAAKGVQKAVADYYDAQADQMLIPPVWNLPADYRSGDYFKGGLDQTCQSTTVTAVAQWCSWMRWNLPGPLGDNPYAKAPMAAGSPVPLLIAQGTDDNIIHCIAPEGLATSEVPGPADCMSRALFDSLSATAYCRPGTTQGHLELDTFRKVELRSPGTHFSIPGQISAKGGSISSADLVFEGSLLQRFMASAFDRSAGPGCATTVLNP